MGGLVEFLEISNEYLWHGLIVFLRTGAVVALLPAFGEQSVPARIKLILALSFTMIVAPAVEFSSFSNTPSDLAFLAMTEVASGLIIGLGIRLFILALQTAGAIAAQSTSLSQLLGGAAVEPLAAIGYVLMFGGMALAVIAGLHIKAAELLILSFDFLPIGRFAGGGDVGEWGTKQVSKAFALAFTLSAPFILVSVLYNLMLGVINKAMPQLMVAFVGAPLITAGGLFILCLAAPVMLAVWLQAFDQFLFNPFGNLP